MIDFLQNNWWQLLAMLPLVVLVVVLVTYIWTKEVIVWIILILFFLGLFSLQAKAEIYQYSNGLKIEATTFKQASKLCFMRLTNGVYPGEERGLDIIDFCANPKKGNVLK